MTQTTATERDLLKRAADALMACAAASLTVKPELDAHRLDRSGWTLYSRWMERPADEATELAMQIRKHLNAQEA